MGMLEHGRRYAPCARGTSVRKQGWDAHLIA